MLRKANLVYVLLMLMLVCFMVRCKGKHAAVQKEIVKKPAEMDDQVTDNIKAVLQFAEDNNGRINDSIKLNLPGIVNAFYDKNDYHRRESDLETASLLH